MGRKIMYRTETFGLWREGVVAWRGGACVGRQGPGVYVKTKKQKNKIAVARFLGLERNNTRGRDHEIAFLMF